MFVFLPIQLSNGSRLSSAVFPLRVRRQVAVSVFRIQAATRFEQPLEVPHTICRQRSLRSSYGSRVVTLDNDWHYFQTTNDFSHSRPHVADRVSPSFLKSFMDFDIDCSSVDELMSFQLSDFTSRSADIRRWSIICDASFRYDTPE